MCLPTPHVVGWLVCGWVGHPPQKGVSHHTRPLGVWRIPCGGFSIVCSKNDYNYMQGEDLYLAAPNDGYLLLYLSYLRPRNGIRKGWNRSNFGEIWGVGDLGSLLGSFWNIKKNSKNFRFLTPNFFRSPAPYKSYRGPSQNLGLPYLGIYVELRDFTSATFFSYFEVLYPNPLSDGPHRSIYPVFQTYPFFGSWTPKFF